MLEKSAYPARRDCFILGYLDIDGCIQLLMRDSSWHISAETVDRLNDTNCCLSWIRWAQSIEKDHQNDLSEQL